MSALMLGNLGHGPDENAPTYRREQVGYSLGIVSLHYVLVKTIASYHCCSTVVLSRKFPVGRPLRGKDAQKRKAFSYNSDGH